MFAGEERAGLESEGAPAAVAAAAAAIPASECSASAAAEGGSSCPQLARAQAAATAARGGTPPLGEPATRDLSVDTSAGKGGGGALLPGGGGGREAPPPPRLARAAAAAAAWIGLNRAVAASAPTARGRACLATAAAQSQSTIADAGSLEGRRGALPLLPDSSSPALPLPRLLRLSLPSPSLSVVASPLKLGPTIPLLLLLAENATADEESASISLAPG